MKDLYELKEKLCDELKSYGKKDMTAGSLDVIDKLAHAIKNIDKIIDGGGYSGNYYNGVRSYRRYSRDNSYHGDVVSELRELMEDAPDERTKMEFKRFISKIESM